MSIVNKIQLAQEKVLEIFQLLEEQGLDVTNQNSLVELKEAVQEYIDSHHGKANFTILNSVSTNGNQFLDTGIKMNNNIGVELKFRLEDWNDGESLGGFVFDNEEVNILKNENGIFKFSISLQDEGYLEEVDDAIHVLEYNSYDNLLYFDGIEKAQIGNIEPLDLKNLLIFANSINGSKSIGKIFSCKIFDINTEEILRFFIPVINDDNERVCLYDLVSQEYFYSSGSEDFYQ